MNIFNNNRGRSPQFKMPSGQTGQISVYLIVAMVLTWILVNSVPSLLPYFAFVAPQVMSGKITSLILYPLVEPNLLSIVFQGLMLYMIGRQFEQELGVKKYLTLFGVGALSGAVFGLGLYLTLGLPIVLTSMYSFIMTLFLLMASRNPNAEIMFFFVFRMRMITMIYISLGMLILMATVKGQHSLWATLFSVMVGFSFIRSFKELNFLVPDAVSKKFKKKSHIRVIRHGGEYIKTNTKDNVVKFKRPDPNKKPEL